MLFIGHNQKEIGCADGIGALLAAFTKFGRDADYAGLDNRASLDNVEKLLGQYPNHDEIIIMDVMPPIEALEYLCDQGKKVTILDHHNTNATLLRANKSLGLTIITDESGIFEAHSDKFYAYFNENSSGAEIAYQYLHSNEPEPAYIKLLGAMDLTTSPYPQSVVAFGKAKLLPPEGVKNATYCTFILDHWQFYTLAAYFDNKLAELHHNYAGEITLARLEETLELFNTNIEDLAGKGPLIEALSKQVAYHEQLAKAAKLIPSRHCGFTEYEGVDSILLVDGDNETGRTIETILAERVTHLAGVIVVIGNLSNGKDSVKLSLRHGSKDTYAINLGEIAKQWASTIETNTNQKTSGGGRHTAAAIFLPAQAAKCLRGKILCQGVSS